VQFQPQRRRIGLLRFDGVQRQIAEARQHRRVRGQRRSLRHPHRAEVERAPLRAGSRARRQLALYAEDAQFKQIQAAREIGRQFQRRRDLPGQREGRFRKAVGDAMTGFCRRDQAQGGRDELGGRQLPRQRDGERLSRSDPLRQRADGGEHGVARSQPRVPRRAKIDRSARGQRHLDEVEGGRGKGERGGEGEEGRENHCQREHRQQRPYGFQKAGQFSAPSRRGTAALKKRRA